MCWGDKEVIDDAVEHRHREHYQECRDATDDATEESTEVRSDGNPQNDKDITCQENVSEEEGLERGPS